MTYVNQNYVCRNIFLPYSFGSTQCWKLLDYIWRSKFASVALLILQFYADYSRSEALSYLQKKKKKSPIYLLLFQNYSKLSSIKNYFNLDFSLVDLHIFKTSFLLVCVKLIFLVQKRESFCYAKYYLHSEEVPFLFH